MIAIATRTANLFHGLIARIANIFKSMWKKSAPLVEEIVAALDPEEESPKPQPKKSFGGWIVRHGYSRPRKHRRRYKQTRRASYVSTAIREDYGAILSRRQRRRLGKMGMPFTPYYN